MPVRVNLLAESLALAEERRRDPIKRAGWIGGFLVALTLLWYLSLWLSTRHMVADLDAKNVRWKQLEQPFKRVEANVQQIAEINRKLMALHQLATNRFLVALTLNALQHAIVENVQVTKLKIDQTFALLPETKTITNADKTVTPGKPARASEKVALTIEGHDYSTPLGDQVGKFKESILATSFFQSHLKTLDAIRMTGFVRQTDLSDPSRIHGAFTLECRFPEKTR